MRCKDDAINMFRRELNEVPPGFARIIVGDAHKQHRLIVIGDRFHSLKEKVVEGQRWRATRALQERL
jgi:hypothetical protein